MEPLVTVSSKQAQVDKQLASKEVLSVLPETDAGVTESYIATRLDSAKNGLPEPVFPSGSDQAGSSGQKQVLTIISEAQLDDGSSALISTMVIESEDNPSSPFKVLKWQHGASSDASLFSDEMSQLLVFEYAEPEFDS
jgi:general secretion pathway protein K